MRGSKALLLFVLLGGGCGRKEAPVLTGLDVLEAQAFAPLKGKRVGVITNPTGVDRSLRGLPEILALSGIEVVAIFAPEHGFGGAAGAGELVGDLRDKRTGVPIYSLYGKVRRPTKEMLQGMDVLLFDIQDIGVRTYTYLSTLAEALFAAQESRVELWVLDRPVPGGADKVEGPVLEAAFTSFVGPHTVPLRHGLTAGEFALLFNEERGVHASLRVIGMQGYRRELPYESTNLLWIAPSPNIPTLDAAIAYAGMVLIEGTNLSEGRGTTRPFQLIGAPWVDGDELAARLAVLRLEGSIFRSARFVPAASKYQGVECGGVELHVTNRRSFQAVRAAVALLDTVKRLRPDELKIQPSTFDNLAGTASLRESLERGAPLEEIAAGWQQGLAAYLERRERILIYR